jgi:plastocyanin
MDASTAWRRNTWLLAAGALLLIALFSHQILIRAEDESGLMGNICRTMVEKGGYRFAWVCLVEPGETLVIKSNKQRPGKYSFRCDLHPTMKGEAYVMEVPAA